MIVKWICQYLRIFQHRTKRNVAWSTVLFATFLILLLLLQYATFIMLYSNVDAMERKCWLLEKEKFVKMRRETISIYLLFIYLINLCGRPWRWGSHPLFLSPNVCNSQCWWGSSWELGSPLSCPTCVAEKQLWSSQLLRPRKLDWKAKTWTWALQYWMWASKMAS